MLSFQYIRKLVWRVRQRHFLFILFVFVSLLQIYFIVIWCLRCCFLFHGVDDVFFVDDKDGDDYFNCLLCDVVGLLFDMRSKTTTEDKKKYEDDGNYYNKVNDTYQPCHAIHTKTFLIHSFANLSKTKFSVNFFCFTL